MLRLRLPLRLGLAISLAFAVGCDPDPVGMDAEVPGVDAGPSDPPPPSELAGVEQTGRFVIPELSGHVHVVRTEHDVPHIYAENRLDAWRVLGFTMAKDRFFQMDLTARLSLGTLSQLLGDAALATDIENRQTGATCLSRRAARICAAPR